MGERICFWQTGAVRHATEDAMSSLPPSSAQENVVWSGTPSQLTNLGLFLLCAVVGTGLLASAIKLGGTWRMPLFGLLLLPIGVALWRYLMTSTQLYTLTDQRLILRRGVLSRTTDYVELYRIKDSHFTQSFSERMLGLGTIRLRTTQDSAPIVELNGMHAPEPLWNQIRTLVEARRDAKGVRELDMHSEPAGG
jgi:uncharacterized membrane protein YdbT with pleckstrin-like domain